MKKKIAIILAIVMFSNISNSMAFAAEEDNNKTQKANTVISTQEDVIVPDNVTFASLTASAVSVTYDHNSGITWSGSGAYRQVWGSTQAMQGKIHLDSYTRARFETWPWGSPYCDSGRCWSTNQGRSYAISGKEKYYALDSGVAHTYYGIGD